MEAYHNGLVFYDGAYNPDADYGSSITLDASGRILIAGTSYNGSNLDMAVWRYNATGILDNTFGTNGVTLIDAGGSDVANDIRIDGSGNIVVAGYGGGFAATDYDMLLARLTSAGVLDTTFDVDGIASYDGGPGEDRAESIDIDLSGRIVATGRSDNGSDFDIIVWRYEP